MAGRVVRGAVLPTPPHDAAPGAADGAQRARVVVAAGAGGGVAVLRPRVPVTGTVGSVQNAARSRLLHPHRNEAVLRLPDSIATAAWPASPVSASRVG